ncbi:hypothetical protein K2173_022054 [Erythroxylum novogranatense]|uniref:Uncharacterized protein n=1 Tax=Erythroxylum novogranatense TaxID=1862640 RepID=A0AAV8T2N1_9ROSI|nr:hypothetical protein K2173_022054 [Erythroxylum novogranatense]
MQTLSVSKPLFRIQFARFIVSKSMCLNPEKKSHIGFNIKSTKSCSLFCNLSHRCNLIQKSLPLVASIVLLLSANPAKAGFLSGFSGIESVPGPELPQIDFLSRFNEENQKKYAENDARFKSSRILKELLERSKVNKEKNKKEIEDKYCIRGAEWGVGDCSAEGMTVEDREKFISMLKQKAGIK